MTPAGAGHYRGRYAPSPTGGLHLGNARTALLAWLRARSQGGALVLRVEDLDGPRTVPAAVTGNLAELRWLGLDWDEGPDVGGPHAPYRQSERGSRYRAALDALERQGRVYPCYLSRRDLRAAASAPHAPAAVYGPAQRRANERARASAAASGRTPSWRFRTSDGELAFDDLLAGPQRVVPEHDVGDVVVRRSDGLWGYHLAVVVDDAAMAITEVVRGDDLLPATAVQLELFRALGAPAPRYAHVPLLLDGSGQRLAKRRGALTLHALRAAGVPPQRVVGWLAHGLGLIEQPEAVEASELLPSFALERVGRSAVTLDAAALAWLTG